MENLNNIKKQRRLKMNTNDFLEFAEKEKGSNMQVVQKYLETNKCTFEETAWMFNVLEKKKRLASDLLSII